MVPTKVEICPTEISFLVVENKGKKKPEMYCLLTVKPTQFNIGGFE